MIERSVTAAGRASLFAVMSTIQPGGTLAHPAATLLARPAAGTLRRVHLGRVEPQTQIADTDLVSRHRESLRLDEEPAPHVPTARRLDGLHDTLRGPRLLPRMLCSAAYVRRHRDIDVVMPALVCDHRPPYRDGPP